MALYEPFNRPKKDTGSTVGCLLTIGTILYFAGRIWGIL